MVIDREETFEQMARGTAFQTAAQTEAPLQYGRQMAMEAGTYRAEEDPQYWEHLGVAMDMQTPEAQEAVWRRYGEGLPHRDFEEFQQQAFQPAEDTPRYHELRQLREQTDHLIQEELPHAAEMMQFERDEAELQLESIRTDLEFAQETFEDRLRQAQAEADQAALSVEAQELQNQFQEWQQQFEMEELAPRQLREYDLELAGLEQRVRHDERMNPIERDLTLTQLEAERGRARSALAQATIDELEAEEMEALAREGLLRETLLPSGPDAGVDDAFTPEDFAATDFDRAMMGLQAGAGMDYLQEYLGDYAEGIGLDAGPDLDPDRFLDAITGPEGYIQDPERGTLWIPPQYMQDVAMGQLAPEQVIVHRSELEQLLEANDNENEEIDLDIPGIEGRR